MSQTQPDDAIEELTRPVIKLLVALVGLFILGFIVQRLPGIETRIPGLELPAGLIASAIISLVMAGVVLNFGRDIEPRLRDVLSGPRDVVRDIAEIAKYLTYIFAIILAYDGLRGTVRQFLIVHGEASFDPNAGTLEAGPAMFAFDIIFLLLALVPTAIVALRIYNNIDEITDVLTQGIKSATVSEVECPSCSESVRASLEYCPNCGEAVPDDAGTTGPSTSRCPDCNTDVDPGMEFCGSCGSDLSTAD